ncbi:MAG: M1 family metallopeptidase [Saprospiraceae bacterium]|nr:M1 family metallopeptidase [Saprospiraceae bacterium]
MKNKFTLFFSAALASAVFMQCTAPKTTMTTPSVPMPSTATTNTLGATKTVEERWQQRAEYTMDVDFDHTKHQYTGKQSLVYYNNSGDALSRAFYHLYPNAFQPGSIMDVRSLTISDPDPRVSSRISKLKPNEIGYLNVKNLKMNGKPCTFKMEGTILEVELPEKIAPLSKVVFECEFDGQVPIQIRRSGRDSKEGVDYSMAQWYPKLCEYDEQGWHANPYVGREFYGIWGDFDVTIRMDKRFTIGGTGVLQNPSEIGKGYSNAAGTSGGDKLAWHFKAQNVHDFMFGADTDYKHVIRKADDGTLMHFFYIPSEKTEPWEKLPDAMSKVFGFVATNYGKYPYSDFSFVQGGDGGMEYAMSTLITGERNWQSLVGVSVHELMHSWYQGVLGSNESLYSWMDEGFTSFTSNYIMNDLKKQKFFPNMKPEDDPMEDDVAGYCRYALSGREEPLSTHSDHFNTNTAFSIGSYVKGATFLQQIKYIIGDEAFNKGFLNYFNTWKFKHPNANDVIRVFEKESNLELDWFKEYFVYTTKTIDYGVENVVGTTVKLGKEGLTPMPLDVLVTYKDGSTEMFYIPIDLMRGEKPTENAKQKRSILKDWTWVNPTYEFQAKGEVKSVVIDASMRMADVNRENNVFPKGKGE